LPVRQTDRRSVEPRVELPGKDSGQLLLGLLTPLWEGRPPDAFLVIYATLGAAPWNPGCPADNTAAKGVRIPAGRYCRLTSLI
jgi:hypothetical protein